MLSHRPELFEIYVSSGIDLVLSGHAHGGQFRLPFIGGLIAPNQGLFLKYDAGLYTGGETNMVVSRGVGNSIIPVRFEDDRLTNQLEIQCSCGFTAIHNSVSRKSTPTRSFDCWEKILC